MAWPSASVTTPTRRSPTNSDSDGSLLVRSAAEGGLEVGGEQHTVRELGEVVVGGPVLELALDVGVVGDSGDHPDDRAGLVGDRGQPTADGADRTRGAHEAEVDDAGADSLRRPGGRSRTPAHGRSRERRGVDARADGRGLVPGEVLEQPIGVDEPAVRSRMNTPMGS